MGLNEIVSLISYKFSHLSKMRSEKNQWNNESKPLVAHD